MSFFDYQFQPNLKLVGDLLLKSIEQKWGPHKCNRYNLDKVISKLSKKAFSEKDCERKVNKFMNFAINHPFDGTPERINQIFHSWRLQKKFGAGGLGFFGQEPEGFQQTRFEDEMPERYKNSNCGVFDMWNDLMHRNTSLHSPYSSNRFFASMGNRLTAKELDKSEQIERWKAIQQQKHNVIYNHFCLRVIPESLLEDWYRNNIWGVLICKRSNGNIIIHGQPSGSKDSWQWTELSDPGRLIKINLQMKFVQTNQLSIDALHLISQGHREDSLERWEPSYLIARSKRKKFTEQALCEQNHQQDYVLTEGLCLLLKNKLKDLDREKYLLILGLLDSVYEAVKEFSPSKKNLPRITLHEIMQNIVQNGLQNIQIMGSIHEWFSFLSKSWTMTKAYQRNKAAFEQVCYVMGDQNFKSEVTYAIMEKELQTQKKQTIDRTDIVKECLGKRRWGNTSIRIMEGEEEKAFFVKEEFSLCEWDEKWLRTKYEKKIFNYFKQCSDDLLIFMNQSDIIMNEIQSCVESSFVFQHCVDLSERSLQLLFNKILSWFTPLNINDENLRELFLFEIEKEFKCIFHRHISTIQEQSVRFQLYLYWMTPWLIAFQGIQAPPKKQEQIEEVSRGVRPQTQAVINNPLQTMLTFQQCQFLCGEVGLRLSREVPLTVLEFIECLLEDQENRLIMLQGGLIPRFSHQLRLTFLESCNRQIASRYTDYVQKFCHLIIELEGEKQRLLNELNDSNIHHFLELLILTTIRYVRSGSNYNLRAIQSFIDNPENQIGQLFQDLQVHAFSSSSFSLVQANEIDSSDNTVVQGLPNLGTSCFFNQAMLAMLAHASYITKILNDSFEEEFMEMDSKKYSQEIVQMRSESRQQLRELVTILQGQRQVQEEQLIHLLRRLLFFSFSFSRGQHHDPDEVILKIQDLFYLESTNVPISIADQQFVGREVSMQDLVSEIVLPAEDENIILTINRSSYFRCRNQIFLLKCDKTIQGIQEIVLPTSNELEPVHLRPICFTCHVGFGVNGEGGHYIGFYQSQQTGMWIHFDDKRRFTTNISDMTVLLETYPLILNHCTQVVYQVEG